MTASNFIEQYKALVNTEDHRTYATQDELDQIGFLLDRLEELEIFIEKPSITAEEYDLASIEMNSVMDRMDLLMEKL